jgi:hypothetical protein
MSGYEPSQWNDGRDDQGTSLATNGNILKPA